MQVGSRHPSDAIIRMLDLVDRFRDRFLDLIVHPHGDERAHAFGLAIPKVVAEVGSCLAFSPMRHWIPIEISRLKSG